jgi:sulfur carrier protein
MKEKIMAVKMILRKKEYELEAKGTLKDALKQLNLSPEAYLAMRNGEMITEDEVLKDGDVIQLIAVISGG